MTHYKCFRNVFISQGDGKFNVGYKVHTRMDYMQIKETLRKLYIELSWHTHWSCHTADEVKTLLKRSKTNSSVDCLPLSLAVHKKSIRRAKCMCRRLTPANDNELLLAAHQNYGSLYNSQTG